MEVRAIGELPVGHAQLARASGNGRYMTTKPPPAQAAYVQLWGFPTAGDLATATLVLIAQHELQVNADAVSMGEYEPRRT